MSHDKNELEIWLCAGISMARKGLIVSAYGVCQTAAGKIVLGDFGFRPSPALMRDNVCMYVNKATCKDMVSRWIDMARLARDGKIIGIAVALVFRDGISEMIAVGSLCGMLPLITAMRFGAYSFPERRSGVDRRSGDRRK